MLVSNVASTTLSSITHREFTVESTYDGLPLSVLEVTPVEEEPKAVVYLAHGLCGCKERFLPFMEYLASNGIACVANDHRGHGSSIRSESDRGYTYQGGAEAMVKDMEVVADYIETRYKDISVTLLGHSMGSLAARAFLKQNDNRIDKVVLCGSPSPNPLAPFGRMVVNIMAKRDEGRRCPKVLQKFTSRLYNRKFKHEGEQAWTCSDATVREQFASDPKCNFSVSADLARTLMDLFKEAYSRRDWRVSNPELPIIFLSGDDDPCMISKRKFERSVKRMSDRGYLNVQQLTYPKMRHEILNEIDKQRVWSDILTFINSVKRQ